jgi:hypothetical protein
LQPSDCDRHNALLTIIHVLESTDGDSEDDLLDKMLAHYKAHYEYEHLGDLRAFIKVEWDKLHVNDDVCAPGEDRDGSATGQDHVRDRTRDERGMKERVRKPRGEKERVRKPRGEKERVRKPRGEKERVRDERYTTRKERDTTRKPRKG